MTTTARLGDLPPCPADCNRDCPTCHAVAAAWDAARAAHTASVAAWRQAGGARYNTGPGGTTNTETGTA